MVRDGDAWRCTAFQNTRKQRLFMAVNRLADPAAPTDDPAGPQHPFRRTGRARRTLERAGGATMHAAIGERLVIHGKQVGQADRHGEILEVRGADGGPPYVVRFDDGHETLLYPGADCELEHEHQAH